MTRYKYVFLILGILSFLFTSAQKKEFIKAGKIVYEKRTNVLALLKGQQSDGDEDIFFTKKLEMFKTNNQPFQVVNFDLDFSDNKSLFYKSKIANPLEQNLPEYVSLPAQENIVFNNFGIYQCIAEKNISGKIYLITDSLRKINWKITDETREIAGFQCRRANALIMDSIYIVAFYCPQIIAPVGPESITGLPGAILGLALPYAHVTWFASKISTIVDPSKIIPPTKGQKISGTAYKSQIKERYSNDWVWWQQLKISGLL